MKHSLFQQAQGWQLLSTPYSASNTSVHTLQMYHLQSTITESNRYLLKVITLTPSLSSHSLTNISLKYKHLSNVRTEILALQRMRGFGSVVELYQVITEEAMVEFFSNFLRKTINKGKYVGLLMQYCPGGTLKDYLSKNSPTEKQIISLSLQIMECLLDLQECKILHRDLRSSNLVFSQNGQLKVIDFDCAFIGGCSGKDSLRFAIVQAITAPEIIELFDLSEEDKERMSQQEMWKMQQKCDLYSLGTLIYEMATKQELKREDWQSSLQGINLSIGLKDLIRMLLKESSQRITHQQTMDYLACLAQRQNIAFEYRKKRKPTRQPLNLPQIDTNPSISSQSLSISNTVSLSDWSLGSAGEMPPEPTRHPQRTTTLALNLQSVHQTLH